MFPTKRRNGRHQIGSFLGFLFEGYAPSSFEEAAFRAIALYQDRARWTEMMRHGMARDFGWERSVRLYQDEYRKLLATP